MRRLKKLWALLLAALFAVTLPMTALAAGYPTEYAALDSDGARPLYGFLEAHKDELINGETLYFYPPSGKGYDNSFTARVAFTYDHPELFWAEMMTTQDRVDRMARYTCFSRTPYAYREGIRDLEADKALLESVSQRVVEEAQAAGSTRYDQVLYLHDWITTHNRYNNPATEKFDELVNTYGEDWKQYTDRTYSNALGALDENVGVVCEGYALGFKLLCDKADIPCAFVYGTIKEGTEHAWNYVMMEDGQWYGVDCTWDDISVRGVYDNRSGYENHDYFLKGSSSFFQNNRAQSKFSYMTFPALSETDYVPGAYTGEPVPYTALRIDMSLANATVMPTPTPSPTPYVFVTPEPTPEPDTFRGLLHDDYESFGDWFENEGCNLLFIILAVLAIVIIILVRRARRKRRE